MGNHRRGCGFLFALFAVMIGFFAGSVQAGERNALPAPIAEPETLGAAVFVSFDTEKPVVVNHIAGKIVVTFHTTDSVEPDSKMMEAAIAAIKEHKETLKKAERNKKEKADDATRSKYSDATRADIPKTGITWAEMLILRERPHISTPYDDPNFVRTCKGGECSKVVKL